MSDLDDLSVSDLSYLQDLRDQIVHQRDKITNSGCGSVDQAA